MKKALSSRKQLDDFLAKYEPEIASAARTVRAKLRKRFPDAFELVYDNYNALVIGFGPTERPSEAILSMVLNPRWVSICFIQGAMLSDPKKILQGNGNQVRFIRLERPSDLDKPVIRALISEAEKQAFEPFGSKGKGSLIIRSISAKQRPRRPRQPKR